MTAEELATAARAEARLYAPSNPPLSWLLNTLADRVAPPKKPAKAARVPKAPKEPRATKASATTARTPKAAPDGKRALVVELCLRPEGATPADLFAATGWNKAPWKWLLHSPKGDGLAQRYGFDFRAQRDENGARYFFTRQA